MLLGRNHKGRKYCRCAQQAAEGSLPDLTVLVAFIKSRIATESQSVTPYESDGSMKSDEDMALGLSVPRIPSTNTNNRALSQKTTISTKIMTLRKHFPTVVLAGLQVHHSYYATLAEATDRMYDYLVQRDNVCARIKRMSSFARNPIAI